MLNVVLYQSRLVPRWLSGWGLVGAALYLVPSLASMFGFSLGVLMAPLAVQEMVLAVWLIGKGFNPSAAVAPRWRTAAPSTLSATWTRASGWARATGAPGPEAPSSGYRLRRLEITPMV